MADTEWMKMSENYSNGGLFMRAAITFLPLVYEMQALFHRIIQVFSASVPEHKYFDTQNIYQCFQHNTE
jgi:hypothetical protein